MSQAWEIVGMMEIMFTLKRSTLQYKHHPKYVISPLDQVNRLIYD